MATVLVAEDDRHIRALLVDILFDAGFDVIEASNGSITLEKAIQEQPDALLLDIRMPLMDGFQVLHELRGEPSTESMPVVLLTALPAISGEPESINLGVLHYLTKPWEPGIVAATIRVAIRESQVKASEKGEDTEVWAGSSSYSRVPDETESQKFIKTDDALSLLGQMLGGGLTMGSLMLIEGAATEGKSVICQHLAYGSLLDDHPTAYFTSEHDSASLTRQMGSIGLEVSPYLEQD